MERRFADHRNFASFVQGEGAIGPLGNLDSFNLVDGLNDLLHMGNTMGANGYIARNGLPIGSNNINGSQIAAEIAYGGGNAGKHSGAIANYQAHGDAIGRDSFTQMKGEL